MLDWLTGWVVSWAPLISQAIRDFVHWAVHALASVILAVFRHVTRGWKWFVFAIEFWGYELIHFAGDVWAFARRVVRVYIPRLIKWASRWITFLHKLALAIYHDLLTGLAILRKYAYALALSVWHNALKYIWAPLKKYADLIWHDLLKWGYTAWWWITHPANLAESLFWFIVNSLERHAWEAAGKVGKFALAVVVKNMRRLVILAEDILSAVL